MNAIAVNTDFPKQSIYEIIKDGYSDYQKYVNNGKFIPAIDGLKLVQRRYLLATREEARNSFEKSNLVLGKAMGKWHPHETQDDALYALVKGGLIKGQGNFGLNSTYRNNPAAAIRYTEVKYNSDVDNILFRFEDYFNMIDGECGNKEPEFLITPIPIALLRGCVGIGVGGVRTKIPAFTYASILEAYAADNPSLLKSAYGLEIDHEKSTLDKLWNIGHGKLVLKFKYKKNDNGSIELSGDATVAKPKLGKLISWEKQKLITIKDMSTTHMKLVFSRVKGVRKISDKDILDEVKKAAVIDDQRSIYIIMFSHRGQAIKMGIKGWVDETMRLYTSTFEKWKYMEIEKFKKSIDRLELIPVVAKHIQDQKSSAEIAQLIDRSEKFVKSIEGLPLRMLRKDDFSKQIDRLRKEIEKTDNSSVKDFIQNGLNLDKIFKDMNEARI